ncbi:unnamed protein product [Dibothriocephalus latus]|uniref:Uncharacterized protein n=1 Tax=Dibothriocephalus latus TaxID=60516 RepID=A0A3P7MJX8_DIBLA|nr:unnamed protein product [Dibothriocephalus latus]
MAQKAIGTHNAIFHCDEVLAIAMFKQLPEYKNADIIRTRDNKELATCNIVVDVGSVFDAASNRFDHHQPSFKLTIKDFHPKLEPSVKLSSAGLIYAHFGKRVITEIAGKLNSDEDLEAVFKRALALVSDELVANVRRLVDEWLPARTIVKGALKSRFSVHPSGMIVKMTSPGCPWMEHIYDLEKEEMDITQTAGPLPFSGRPVFIFRPGTRASGVTAISLSEDQPYLRR